MATLTGTTIASTYDSLLHVEDDTAGLVATSTDSRVIQDGVGANSALALATDSVRITSTNKLYFNDIGGEYISGNGTALTLNSGEDINLTCATGDINIPVNIGLRFGDGNQHIETDNTDLTITSDVSINLSSPQIDLLVDTNFVTTGGVNGMSIDGTTFSIDGSNNRVGIGTATPDGMLDISSSSSGLPNVFIQNSSTSQQTGGAIIFTNIDTDTNLGDNIIIGEILAKAGDPSDDALINAGRIKFQMDGVGATNDIDGKIAFETGTGNGTLTERLTIKAAGNIGVGTDTPDTKLEVVGSFAANGPSSTFVTMAESDTSPDVSTGNIFKSHSTGVTIDQFDGGICGQIITIISGGATVYDVTSSELNGGTTNITTAAGDVTMWVCESATDWHLLSWMDLSIDLSSGGF